MKGRKFAPLSAMVHEEWAALVLNMKINDEDGADLRDLRKTVEIKFALEGSDHGVFWKIRKNQLEYKNGKPAYWLLGSYTVRKPIKKIKEGVNDKETREIVEYNIQERVAYLVSWEWVRKNFEARRSYGKRGYSRWDEEILYATRAKLPEITETYEVGDAKIYLTKGVPKRSFRIRTDDIPF